MSPETSRTVAGTTASAASATPHPSGPLPTAPARTRRRDLVAVNIGNALEWFDWNIYAIFAPFFAAQFFRGEDAITGLLSTLVIFAVGFLMRPIGGWVFGHIADSRGRRFSLTLAIGLAAIGSLVIAVAPTFDVIGPWAALILLLARLVQGMSHGGETGSAFTYLAEVAPEGRRGLWASSPWIGVGIGSILATGLGALLTAILTDEQMAAFGWRIPFGIAALLGLYALWIRFGLTESEKFTASSEKTPSVRDTFRLIGAHRSTILRITGLTIGGVTVFYTWLIFAPGYATRTFGIDPTTALLIGVAGQAVLVVMAPVFGALSDRLGRRPVLQIFSIGFAVVAFGLDAILGPSPWTLLLALLVAGLLISANTGPLGATFAELVPTRERATVIGVGYATSAAIFGGTAPYLNTWLESIGLHWIYTAYLVALCLISAIVIWRMPETAREPLR